MNVKIFMQKWAKQLDEVESILMYLNTYPDVLKEMGCSELIPGINIEIDMGNWLRQFNQFDNLEKEFYNEHWIPIERTAYKFFIDLSSPKYPIYEVMDIYGKGKKEKYIRSVLFESVIDLLLMIDQPKVLKEYLEVNLFERNYSYLDEFLSDPF